MFKIFKMKLDASKILLLIIIIILVVCILESRVMKTRSTYIYRVPQTYIEAEIKEMPIIIYNKRNVSKEDKQKFKEFKYKTKPKILIGDKTNKLVKNVKENFVSISSVNDLIDSGLHTMSDVLTLKQPIESKYRIVSNTPINNVFCDDKFIYFK